MAPRQAADGAEAPRLTRRPVEARRYRRSVATAVAGHICPAGVSLHRAGPVTERLRVRKVDHDEGQRLVRVIRRGNRLVVPWRRVQMVLLSAQGMDLP